MIKRSGIYLFIALLCVFLFYTTYYVIMTNINDESSNTNDEPKISTLDVLLTESQEYKSAHNIFYTDPEQAIDLYNKALLKANSQEEKEFILFSLIQAKIWSGAGPEALTDLKTIVASSTSSNFAKAYAIQSILTYFNSSEEIKLVYQDEPYASFFRASGGDLNRTYKMLSEYGLSFYNLPELQLRKALNEADKLANIVSKYSSSSEEFNISKRKLLQSIEQIDEGLIFYKNSPYEFNLPKLYNSYAILLAKLKISKIDGFNDPAQYFSLAQEYDSKYPRSNYGMFILFYHSAYLAAIDMNTNKQEIDSLVLKLISLIDNLGDNTSFYQSLATISSNKNGGWVYDSAVKISETNVGYKNMLLKANWKFNS